jgi:hypothetical protein
MESARHWALHPTLAWTDAPVDEIEPGGRDIRADSVHCTDSLNDSLRLKYWVGWPWFLAHQLLLPVSFVFLIIVQLCFSEKARLARYPYS